MISIIILLAVIGSFCFLISSVNSGFKEEEKLKKEELRKQQREAEAEKIRCLHKSLSDKYGEPSRVININWPAENSSRKYIMVFASSKILYIDDTAVPFADILSHKIIDNYEIEHGRISGVANTTTDTGSMIGRGIVGGVLGGEIGAAVGAQTASKNTTMSLSQNNDKLIHDYILVVGLKSFAKPTIELSIGNRWRLATEIEAVFNLILERNQSN